MREPVFTFNGDHSHRVPFSEAPDEWLQDVVSGALKRDDEMSEHPEYVPSFGVEYAARLLRERSSA